MNYNYNIRMNVMNINSIKSFVGIKGRFNSGTKDVYFLEISGVNNSEEMAKQIYEMDYKLGKSKCYFRENNIKEITKDNILFYSELYEKNNFQIKFKMNNELNYVYKNAIEKIKKLFIDNTPNFNETILKNFMVKIMYWSDFYLPKIFDVYDINNTYKFVLCGNVKKNEYMFLYFLAFMGVDILYIDYEKQKNFEIKTDYKPSFICYDKKDKINLTCFNNNSLRINNDDNYNINKSNKTLSTTNNENTSFDKVEINDRESKKELDFEEISKFAVKVVMISVLDQNGECIKTGSGFFAAKNGIILTNFHVIQGGAKFAIRMENDNNVFLTDEIIKYDYSRDMAIIRIEKNIQPLNIYKGTNDLVRGQKVAAIGSPLGLFNSVSDGIISGFRNIDDNDFIQFTAPVSHGSSGGALFNTYGQVIGIITAGYDGGQNINLAVSYKMINNFIKGFIN